ncbi:MAG: hypothetical protein AAF228_00115 [Pseudomonadota bacterium]
MTKLGFFSIIACSSLLLASCDTVEINAPILENMGVNLSSSSRPDPKVQSRGDLVVPPNKNLPNPDQIAAQKATKTQDPQLWPDDPDVRKKRLAKLKKEEKKRKRDEIDFEKGDIDEFNKIQGEREQTTGGGLLDGLFGKDD